MDFMKVFENVNRRRVGYPGLNHHRFLTAVLIS
jgi:hypothetical protein